MTVLYLEAPAATAVSRSSLSLRQTAYC